MGETLGWVVNVRPRDGFAAVFVPAWLTRLLGGLQIIMILWTTFEITILAFPTYQPLTALNMNYSSVITLGILALSLVWYYASAKNRYTGPLT